jgi:hypothetical protein
MMSAVNKKHMQIVRLWLQEQSHRGSRRRFDWRRGGPVMSQLVANSPEFMVEHMTGPLRLTYCIVLFPLWRT